MTLDELAPVIKATVRGDGSKQVTACAGLEDATPEHMSFLANRKYAPLLQTTSAGAVILSIEDARSAPDGQNLMVADDPYFAFREALVALHGWREQPEPGISTRAYVDDTAEIAELCTIRPFAFVAPRARIGKRCVIYPGCYIGRDVEIGDDCVLFPNVTIYERCRIGRNVTLHAGCVVGQDGFGYVTRDGMHKKIPAVGNVVIGDDVEMGAGCVVDRATVGATVIRDGCKFSDLVAIGHGSTVGRHNLLVAQVGLAGSVKTGDYVVMGGQVGVAPHLEIGDGVQIAAKSGVMHDLPEKQKYGGQPALPLHDAKRIVLSQMKVPDLIKEVKQLRQRLADIEAAIEASTPSS